MDYKISSSYAVDQLNDELDYIKELGIAWQRDRSYVIDYSSNYWDHYVKLEHTKMGIALNRFRCNLVEGFSNHIGRVLDVGIGCGEFIKKLRMPAFGYDVNLIGVQWLKDRELYCDPYTSPNNFNAVTCWDVLEHIIDPGKFLSILPDGHLFVSIPVFNKINDILNSKHKKFGEHLQYFTQDGIITYLNLYNFNVIFESDEETRLGRENIKTFVFKKQ